MDILTTVCNIIVKDTNTPRIQSDQNKVFAPTTPTLSLSLFTAAGGERILYVHKMHSAARSSIMNTATGMNNSRSHSTFALTLDN